MTMAEITPAIQEAAKLRAVAQHLFEHPHLHPVNVHSDACQIRWTEREAHDLVAWADSLKDATVAVQAIEGDAFVYVTGGMTTGTVTVWKCVTGLREWLGINAKAEKEPMSLAALREFATTQEPCDRR